MPETRYVEVYEQGTGKLLRKEPYEVSDEQLEVERRLKRKDEILKKPRQNWTPDDVKDLIEFLLARE